MSGAPAYFEAVRKDAADMWDLLESRPVVAAPWHTLFEQVQVPRHVVSELLQNADDAGATSASVSIENGEFVFRHYGGEDFSEEHFTSLCRFGYSNKRTLHTIGFRGIGFKSTFSLGDQVCLESPTLSVAFRRKRFTEPSWQDRNEAIDHTAIKVKIKDSYRQQELEKNLNEWLQSPVSLLFFRNIRSFRVAEQEVHWQPQGPGPVPNSEWMALAGSSEKKHLLIRSPEEPFPPDALEEIRQERKVVLEEEAHNPSCRIEIVLGQKGKFFVILPTGITTSLPFACNAPFIQDPARLKIKEPDISPTNRWLLSRIGELAAKSLQQWVGREALSIEEKIQAYSLFSHSETISGALEDTCTNVVEKKIFDILFQTKCLITESGKLARWGEVISIPEALLDVWDTGIILSYFSDKSKSILSSLISPKQRDLLINSKAATRIPDAQILNTLENKRLPLPKNWRRLLLLWVYVAPFVKSYHYQKVNILPTQGSDTLCCAKNIVRLGESKLLHSEEDWSFISQFLMVMNQNWPIYLAKQRNSAKENNDSILIDEIDTAFALLEKLGLGKASDHNSVFQQVVEKVFSNHDLDTNLVVKMAQLAATIEANISYPFKFISRDGTLNTSDHAYLADLDNSIDYFAPKAWCNNHVLHDDYKNFLCCTKEEWEKWAKSGRSKLCSFIPFIQSREWFRNKKLLLAALMKRGYVNDFNCNYSSPSFQILDLDFPDEIWGFWNNEAERYDSFWCRLLDKIFRLPPQFWANASSAKVFALAGNGRSNEVLSGIAPAWIVKFRDLPCLKDTRGIIRQPAELLRRTPDTEALLDVEPFVQADIDNETLRPLFILLGVRDTPTSPTRLLDRLRALAAASNPPAYEVEKWYHRLDQMLNKCSTQDFQEIQNAFAEEKLILIDGGGWGDATEVFLTADEEDAPGVAVIHPAVKDLALWRKIGVAERPTTELAIEWLSGIESCRVLTVDEQRRVRSLLARYPERIWHECEHWLNLENEWAPTSDLAYYVNMQSLVPWKNFFSPVKRKTADFVKLSAELCSRPPFSSLRSLAQCIEDRLEEGSSKAITRQNKPWLNVLGTGLRRVILDNKEETQRVHVLAARLANTHWQLVSSLRITPYIDGSPAGTSRPIEALWKDDLLSVIHNSSAKMLKPVTDALSREFIRLDISDAIKSCYDRPSEFVREYLEENFKLMPEEDLDGSPTEGQLEAAKRPSAQSETIAPPQEQDDDHAGEDNQGDNSLNNLPFEAEVLDSGGDAEQPAAPARRRPNTPAKPSFMERFAVAQGFVKDTAAERFIHPNGDCLIRASGQSFPWERISPSGDLLQCYWYKDVCLEREPLQIEAEVLHLCEAYPEKYSILLADIEGKPVIFSGKQILALKDSDRLKIFPASYRLQYVTEG